MKILSLIVAAMSFCAGVACAAPAEKPLFNGESLLFPSPNAHSQMCSMIATGKNGGIIVYDGGTPYDGSKLMRLLKERGGHVSLWLLSHAHSDHIGALMEILNTPDSGLTIDQIAFGFPPREWQAEHEKDDLDYRDRLTAALPKSKAKITTLKKGSRCEVDGMSVEVLNDYDLALTGNPINNSSLVMALTVAGKRVILPGDLGVQMGDRMVEECAKSLKGDIVVMAHHGQNGVGKNFYAAVAPSIAVWPTPQWLWDNDNGTGPGSGSWATNKTKCWLEELGVKRQYVTVKDVLLR